MPTNGTAAWDSLYDPTNTCLTTRQTDTTVAARLFPSVAPTDQFFHICLHKVVVAAIADKQCLATDANGERCLKTFTQKDFILATQMAQNLGSDPLLLSTGLNKIALMCICKNKNYKTPHYLQAPDIAAKWSSDTTGVGVEMVENVLQKIQGGRQVTKRGLPAPSLVTEAEEVEEGEEVAEMQAPPPKRKLESETDAGGDTKRLRQEVSGTSTGTTNSATPANTTLRPYTLASSPTPPPPYSTLPAAGPGTPMSRPGVRPPPHLRGNWQPPPGRYHQTNPGPSAT